MKTNSCYYCNITNKKRYKNIRPFQLLRFKNTIIGRDGTKSWFAIGLCNHCCKKLKLNLKKHYDIRSKNQLNLFLKMLYNK